MMFRQPATLLILALTAAGSAVAHEHPAPHSHPAEAAALTVPNRPIDAPVQEGLHAANFTAGRGNVAPASAAACGKAPCVRGAMKGTVSAYGAVESDNSAPGLGSLALLGIGLVALGWIRRRQRPPCRADLTG